MRACIKSAYHEIVKFCGNSNEILLCLAWISSADKSEARFPFRFMKKLFTSQTDRIIMRLIFASFQFVFASCCYRCCVCCYHFLNLWCQISNLNSSSFRAECCRRTFSRLINHVDDAASLSWQTFEMHECVHSVEFC